MDLYPSLWYLSIAAVFVILMHRWRSFRCRSNGLLLPPGPRPLPIIGNTLDIPTTAMAARFRDISAIYGESTLVLKPCDMPYSACTRNLIFAGDVMYVSAFGQPMIILDSHEAATSMDLLEKVLQTTLVDLTTP